MNLLEACADMIVIVCNLNEILLEYDFVIVNIILIDNVVNFSN